MGFFSYGHHSNAAPTPHPAHAVAGFPAQQIFWKGSSPYMLLGSGIRYYQLGFIHIKVYGLALYVERSGALAEIARLKAQGFFKDGNVSTERMCSAIAAIKAAKVMQIQLLRSISSSQFTDALSKALKPRLQGTTAYDKIAGFENYFAKKHLSYGCNVPILNTGNGIELDLMPPGNTDFAKLSPNERVADPQFAAALFDIWLAADTPVTGAREQWTETMKRLVQSA